MSGNGGFSLGDIEEVGDDEDTTTPPKAKAKADKLLKALMVGIAPSAGSTDIEWARNGMDFSVRSRADKFKLIPPGIYHYGAAPGTWWLTRNSEAFEFTFKVYSACDKVIDRISKHWAANGGNLGVLMNGTRGAGKTMAAQLLANKLIRERKTPVLSVRYPIPLQVVLDAVRQDLVVIFDEFEKTHDKDHQQMLLSTIDGMSRSQYNRLFIFTTNNAYLDENFKDRPSRIHYQFEFNRVADEIIEGLIDDNLGGPGNEDLMKLKPDILAFLQTRSLCTIDIVKAIIREVKTFRESPTMFEDMLNVSKGEPPAFKISILDPETNSVISVWNDYFKLNAGSSVWSPLLNESKKALQDFAKRAEAVEFCSTDTFAGIFNVTLLEKCKEDGCWMANLALPFFKTFWEKYQGEGLYDNGYRLYMDEKPEDFPVFSLEKVKKNEKAQNELQQKFNQANRTRTVHGTGKRSTFKIKIEPNRTAVRSRYVPSGGFDDY